MCGKVRCLHRGRQEVLNLKRQKVKCYCGAQAVLRPASALFGENSHGGYYYVCAKYPVCDSYVGTHKGSRQPKGTLANAELRRKRIEAHRAFDALWKDGKMKKWQAYRWTQSIFGMNTEQAHIAKFSVYMCDQLIMRCNSFQENRLVS